MERWVIDVKALKSKNMSFCLPAKHIISQEQIKRVMFISHLLHTTKLHTTKQKYLLVNIATLTCQELKVKFQVLSLSLSPVKILYIISHANVPFSVESY